MDQRILILGCLGFLVAESAHAVRTYDCQSKDANDVGLPAKMTVEVDGSNVLLHDLRRDLSYRGKMTGPAINPRGDYIAVGFEDLIQQGHVIISSKMKAGKPSAKLVISDEALDSTYVSYQCARSVKSSSVEYRKNGRKVILTKATTTPIGYLLDLVDTNACYRGSPRSVMKEILDNPELRDFMGDEECGSGQLSDDGRVIVYRCENESVSKPYSVIVPPCEQ